MGNEVQTVLYNSGGRWPLQHFVFDICKVGSTDVVQRRMPVHKLD